MNVSFLAFHCSGRSVLPLEQEKSQGFLFSLIILQILVITHIFLCSYRSVKAHGWNLFMNRSTFSLLNLDLWICLSVWVCRSLFVRDRQRSCVPCQQALLLALSVSTDLWLALVCSFIYTACLCAPVIILRHPSWSLVNVTVTPTDTLCCAHLCWIVELLCRWGWCTLAAALDKVNTCSSELDCIYYI